MIMKWHGIHKLVNVSCLFFFVTVKPGVKYRDVGAVIQKHAQSQGYSVVRSYCGHGIHQLFHTAPSVPHYASEFMYYTSWLIKMNNYTNYIFLFGILSLLSPDSFFSLFSQKIRLWAS